uniref:Uncharacterized protein n=1 Tax=Arundo donax TaxID=35708 RepID=A0A0A9BN49_ARUDO
MALSPRQQTSQLEDASAPKRGSRTSCSNPASTPKSFLFLLGRSEVSTNRPLAPTNQLSEVPSSLSHCADKMPLQLPAWSTPNVRSPSCRDTSCMPCSLHCLVRSLSLTICCTTTSCMSSCSEL